MTVSSLTSVTTATPTLAGYSLRLAQPADCAGARELMLATFTREFGYGYVAAWHQDVDNLQHFYLENPRQALFVAVEEKSGAVVATTGVRTGGPRPGAHPAWLVARYDPVRTAELVRVYVDPAHRRRGLAQALVQLAAAWIRDEGGYTTIYLHTNADVPGAAAFWRALPTVEVYAEPERKQVLGHWLHTVHFELAMPAQGE